MNHNGVISFNRDFNVHTSRSLPLSDTAQIIAPYWADIDINGRAGAVYIYQSNDSILLARASKEIQTALSLTYNVEINNLLIVMWNGVGYYRNTDKVCCNKK